MRCSYTATLSGLIYLFGIYTCVVLTMVWHWTLEKFNFQGTKEKVWLIENFRVQEIDVEQRKWYKW